MIIEHHDARATARLCGFGSVAMIDYLERSGVFTPSRKRNKNRGKRRFYTFRDVLVLRTIKALLDSGTSVAAIKDSLIAFQRIRWKADEAVLEDNAGPLRWLIASGGKIYLARSIQGLVELSGSGQMAFSFVIDIEKMHTELCKDWRQLPLAI